MAHDDPQIDRKPHRRGGPIRRRGLVRFHLTVVTAEDSQGGEYKEVLKRQCEVPRALEHRIAPQCLLCTDGYRSYRRMAMESTSENSCFRQRQRDDQNHHAVCRDPGVVLGLECVTAPHELIKTFVNHRARGVSR